MTKLNDLTVWKQIYDPHADGYLVTGKLKAAASEKPYIMGWRTPHGQKIIDEQRYSSKGWLTRAFKQALLEDHGPKDNIFRKDRRQNKLYHWENTYLLPHTSDIPEKQAKQITRQVCQDYGIEPIKLKWCEEGDVSYYNFTDHTIEFRHRDLVSLLHEIAHGIHEEKSGDKKGPNHSPAFARLAIELYHRYAGFPLDYLIVSANQYGLLGDLSAEQVIFDPQKHPKR